MTKQGGGVGMTVRQGRGDWWIDGLGFLLCGLLSSLWCLGAAQQLGATFDEPVYLERGLQRWRDGSYAGLMQLGTMPLPIDVQTLPLYLYEKATGTPLDPVGDCASILPWARGMTLIFWWLLLVYGYLLGRQIAGRWGGRVAVLLLACEPNLLAHASLATTDIAISATILALVFHFHVSREAGWLRRIGIPGLWFAAAILAKASGMVFGPLAMAAVETERLVRTSRISRSPTTWWSAFAPFRKDLVQIGLLGLALAFVYCGSDWKSKGSFVTWAQNLPEGTPRTAMIWVAENARIFSNTGEGLVRQIRHNVRGHGVYLLGDINRRAIWYYFPVALSIKLPLPLLLLLGSLLILRPRLLANPVMLASLALLLFSLTCRVQIGIRLVLPLIVLGVVGLGAAAARGIEDSTHSRRLSLGFGAALLWMVYGSVYVWPHGLCFANEAWGGPGQAYLRLSDSNFDWGQGLPELARWSQAQGMAELDVWYFGSDPSLTQRPFRPVPLGALPTPEVPNLRAAVRGRYLAAGATLVYGMPCDTESHARAAAFLRARNPITRVGTFLIYDLEEGTVARGP